MKKQNGITLISLIITIIVMLILAGVALSMVMGDGSIVEQANSATENTRGGEVQEYVDLSIASNRAGKYSNIGIKNKEQIIEELKNEKLITQDEANELADSDILQIGDVTIDFSKIDESIDSDIVSVDVGDYVTYSGGGINKWRVVEKKGNGEIVVYAKLSSLGSSNKLSTSFYNSGKSTLEEYYNTFVDSLFANSASLGSVSKYIKALTGKEIAEQNPDMIINPVTGVQITEAELIELGILGMNISEDGLYLSNETLMTATFRTISVDNGLGYLSYDISAVEAATDAFIAVTLKSGLTYTGLGTSESPYIIGN